MAKSRTCFMSKKWRIPKTIWWFFGIELLFTVPALALFAIAQPNTYRSLLRQYGADHGWNSNQNVEAYAIYNHDTSVKTPPPWSEFTTDYNVVVSVLAMFVLLVKAIMFVLHIFWPVVGVITHGAMVGLWGYSLYAQTAGDYLDPAHPASTPWYFTHGCSNLPTHSLNDYCKQAQASLAVTVIMEFLFALNTVVAIWSLFPTKEQREKRQRECDEEDDLDFEEQNFKFPPPPQTKEGKAWETEMQRFDRVQATPTTAGPSNLNPQTPRTQAFNRLGGTSDLPFRRI